jgi:glycosyltransferase involved in cell wall biosynthesis
MTVHQDSYRSSQLPAVLAVGPLPPPMQGAAMTTQGFVDAATAHGAIQTYDISPNKKNRHGIAYIIKPLRVARAIGGVLFSAFRPSKSLYLALDGGFGLIYGIIIAAFARMCGYRIFLHHHSFAYINFPSRLMELLTRVAGPTATHIMLCNAMATQFQHVYPKAIQLRVLSSAAFVPQMDVLERIRGGELRIGHLSNLTVEKGLDTTIDVLREARRRGLGVRLILAGRPFDSQAKTIIESAQAEFGSSLDYIGAIPEETKRAYFQSIDVFIFPTKYINEAQPRVILEALAHGVPVITIARSCILEDVGCEAGLCVEPNADFVETSIHLLQRWSADTLNLEAMSGEALSRSHKLHAIGCGQLTDIVRDLFDSPTAG